MYILCAAVYYYSVNYIMQFLFFFYQQDMLKVVDEFCEFVERSRHGVKKQS